MNAPVNQEEVAGASALYGGFAQAFRYPEAEGGALTGAEYLEAFDMGASGEAASLHEAPYVEMDISALFEELVRFYEHFGLRRNQDAELPDHLSVELEFMHFLSELERHASARGEDVESVCRAERDFLDRHLLRLLHGVQARQAEKPGPAAGLIDACTEFVEGHRQSLAGEA